MPDSKEKTPLKLKVILAALGVLQATLTAAVAIYLDYRSSQHTNTKDETSKNLIAYQQAQLELVNEKIWKRLDGLNTKVIENGQDLKWVIRIVEPVVGEEPPSERDGTVDASRELEVEGPPPPTARPRPRRAKKPELPKPGKDYVKRKRMEQRKLLK
jgi:hypothetical protein